MALRAAVRSALGADATDPFFKNAVVDDKINEAVQFIATDRDWPWLEATTTITTVSGTAGYSLPTDWARTQTVAVNGRQARPMSIEDYRQAESTDGLTPYRYCIYASQILLHPTPGEVFTVRHDYIKTEPSLSGDNDEPLIPDRFSYAVVARACGQLSNRGNDGRIPTFARDYDMWRLRMLDELNKHRGPSRVRVRPGYIGP